jgi:GT2 family glycosyltransferase
LERICRIDEHSFVAAGWLRDVEGSPVRLTIVSPEGAYAEILPAAYRLPRPDVTRFFGGPQSEELEAKLGFAAFLQIDQPNHANEGWRLEYENDAGIAIEVHAQQVVRDPPLIRQTLFDLVAKVRTGKASLLSSVVRPAIELLQRRADTQPKVQSIDVFGDAPVNPRVSIVVPVYGKTDLVEQQLVQFSDDAEIRSADLIYVLDSPELAPAFLPLARDLFQLYRIPFRLIVLERNVGFSGANNAGVAHARGDLVLLLNSDVFPERPGWLSEMANFYESQQQIGALGVKLLYEDCSLQHAGLYFERTENGAIWANAHYFKGLSQELPAANKARRVPGVTAACLMIARKLYLQMNGLQGRYVQGDYEDSDLCLRLLASGFDNWYLPSVALYHLEGQSYPTPLREAASLYNRWLHTELWDAQIAATMRRFSDGEINPETRR